MPGRSRLVESSKCLRNQRSRGVALSSGDDPQSDVDHSRRMTTAREQIDACKWLYLDDVREPSDNELVIRILEAVSGEDEIDANALDPLREIREILRESKPIVHESGCRVFHLRWPTYIAYSVRNESYVTPDDYEDFEGRLFVKYSKSRYLDFVGSATFATSDYPGPFDHYGIYCLNHIIDVVSVSAPEIRVDKAQ